MNYYRQIYETTAWLLMLQVQMREYPFSTVVSRYIVDSAESWSDSQVRAVESVAILLALERSGEPMPAEIIGELDRNIAELHPADFPESADIEADLRTAKSVIEWYRTTDGKLK